MASAHVLDSVERHDQAPFRRLHGHPPDSGRRLRRGTPEELLDRLPAPEGSDSERLHQMAHARRLVEQGREKPRWGGTSVGTCPRPPRPHNVTASNGSTRPGIDPDGVSPIRTAPIAR
ncbi:hypothetical protein GCM10009536_50930 [Streptomyces thermocarboxydus]